MLYVCVVTFQFFGFCFLESSHSLEHFVPIYQGPVKLGTVDADELRLSTDGQTTGSAHSCSVYHDGVERNIGGNVVFLGELAAKFHHDGWTDGEDSVDRLAVDELFDTHGHNTFLAIRAVIGHDERFVGTFAHFVFQDNQVFRPAG